MEMTSKSTTDDRAKVTEFNAKAKKQIEQGCRQELEENLPGILQTLEKELREAFERDLQERLKSKKFSVTATPSRMLALFRKWMAIAESEDLRTTKQYPNGAVGRGTPAFHRFMEKVFQSDD